MGTDGKGSSLPGWLRRALIGRNPKRTLMRIVVLVVVCFILFNFVLVPIRVEGPSMLPTYKERGVNFVNRLAYLFHEPQRGDVIAIRLADPHIKVPHVMYLKRIVGLPGETIAFHRGQLYINGKLLYEPYVRECAWERDPEQLGLDEYYVVGDNRSMDWADHVQGRPTRRKIVGKILL